MTNAINLSLSPREAEMIRLSLVIFGDTLPAIRSGFDREETDGLARRVRELILEHEKENE